MINYKYTNDSNEEANVQKVSLYHWTIFTL